MGSLTMTQDEYNYYVDNIREGFHLIGQKATLYEVEQEIKDDYWDSQLKHREGRAISLIFEDNPKPILKKLNWLTEDQELPYIANVVALDDESKPLEIREKMLIEIHSELGLYTNRLFIVSKVTGNSIDPLIWICKLVPYRYKVVPKEDSSDKSEIEITKSADYGNKRQDTRQKYSKVEL